MRASRRKLLVFNEGINATPPVRLYLWTGFKNRFEKGHCRISCMH
jgi:hypothetical protein